MPLIFTLKSEFCQNEDLIIKLRLLYFKIIYSEEESVPVYSLDNPWDHE